MDGNLLIQYTLVAAALLGALIWIVVKVVKANRKGGGNCCGCALSDHCHKSHHTPQQQRQAREQGRTLDCPEGDHKRDCCR